MTPARLEHFVFALFFLIVYLALLWRRNGAKGIDRAILFALMFPVLYLGSAVSDLDIALLGIGGHRNIFFHSALPYAVFALICRRVTLRTDVLGAAKLAFALGLSSHLVLDVIQYGNVVGIPRAFLDRLWLAGNASALLLVMRPGRSRMSNTEARSS